MIKRFFLGMVVAVFLVFVSGCGSTYVKGNVDNQDVSIKKDKAKELALDLNIGAGELIVNSGTTEWVDGTIEYNKDQLKPEISYKLKGDKGVAVIEQEKDGLGKVRELKNKWKLNLNDEIPIDLHVNTGASETKLDLAGLKLSGLDIKAGVGDITIDLSGKWKESFDASLDMGVGNSTIILPADVGVKIKSSKGIGNTEFVGFISEGNGVYFNEAFEDADVIINVETEMGVGKTTFKLEK
jgi:hypothetical protein